ncbi:hypothetical protein C8Q75DRAFT_730424 [Abortiporus biennis]|nr:hypothetical protein C8Q75DRAFT_730424 [Abortiporus biennis]
MTQTNSNKVLVFLQGETSVKLTAQSQRNDATRPFASYTSPTLANLRRVIWQRQSSRVLSTSHIIHQGWTWAVELACYKFTSLCCMKKFHHKACWVVIPNRPTPTSLLWPYDLTLLHSMTGSYGGVALQNMFYLNADICIDPPNSKHLSVAKFRRYMDRTHIIKPLTIYLRNFSLERWFIGNVFEHYAVQACLVRPLFRQLVTCKTEYRRQMGLPRCNFKLVAEFVYTGPGRLVSKLSHLLRDYALSVFSVAVSSLLPTCLLDDGINSIRQTLFISSQKSKLYLAENTLTASVSKSTTGGGVVVNLNMIRIRRTRTHSATLAYTDSACLKNVHLIIHNVELTFHHNRPCMSRNAQLTKPVTRRLNSGFTMTVIESAQVLD